MTRALLIGPPLPSWSQRTALGQGRPTLFSTPKEDQLKSSPISVAITRVVAPGRDREVAAWARTGQSLISAYPGYLGSGWIRPDPTSSEWNMIFRFADAESLKLWEDSPERAWWICTGADLVVKQQYERRTGTEGWFDTPASVEVLAPAPAPPRWKQMIAITMVFYPLSVGANYALSALPPAVPIWLRVLFSVAVISPVMVYLGLPLITRLLRGWLHRQRPLTNVANRKRR